MVSKKVFLVFVLPVIFSLLFGSAVMADVLQKPDRELNMWPISYSGGDSYYSEVVEFIGLSKQYSTSEPVEIQVKINDSSFDCGDLYITIYTDGTNDAIAQGGFFDQCFEAGSKMLPVGDGFSEVVDTPGSYKIVADMILKELKKYTISETFTVKQEWIIEK